jgi:hypothetical protein
MPKKITSGAAQNAGAGAADVIIVHAFARAATDPAI